MPDSGKHSPCESPWWLAGDELCAFCCQYYSIEVEYRCFECDLPVCPLCIVVVRETRGVACPQCRPE